MIASPNPTFHTSSRHSKAAQADALLAEYLDTQRGFPSFATRASAARHFLYWLRSRRISIAQVGATVVERFARHQCRCQGFHGQGYSPAVRCLPRRSRRHTCSRRSCASCSSTSGLRQPSHPAGIQQRDPEHAFFRCRALRPLASFVSHSSAGCGWS